LKITFWKGVFVADHQPGDEKVLKKVGFVEHEPSLCEPSRCRACRAKIGRRYYSSKIEHASRLKRYCTERALEVMRDHLAKLASSRATTTTLSIPRPPGEEYRPFQAAGIAYAVQHKDTLIGDDMGLGKTVQALGFANYTRPQTILVVAPATLALNWKLEAEKWLCRRHVVVIPQKTTDVLPQPGEIPLLVITNYEKIYGVSRAITVCPYCRSINTRPNPTWTCLACSRTFATTCPSCQSSCLSPSPTKLQAATNTRACPSCGLTFAPTCPHCCSTRAISSPPEISGWTCADCERAFTSDKLTKVLFDTPLSRSLRRPWDLGIFDEAHALKNHESYRSRAVLGEGGLYDCSRRALFLSGTPLEQRPIEIWPIASRLCPAKFGDWWDFARRYCALHRETRGRKIVWVADGSSNHAELQQRLRTSFMIRRTKNDVLKDLPPKCRQMLVLDDSNVDWSKFPELVKWKDHLGQDFDDALARLLSAKTMDDYRRAARRLDEVSVPFTKTSVVRHQVGLAKIDACLRLTDEMLASGLDSLAIFAHHKDILEKIHDHYGDDSCVIYGDTPMDQRIPIVKLFQEGQKKIFVGGLKAAGVGITLTRTSNLVFYESDWNPGTVRQAEDRCCRIGQKKMVNITHPVLDRSLDANMVKMILAKQNVVDKILDNPTEIQLRKVGLESY